jgi:hypothetical protein
MTVEPGQGRERPALDLDDRDPQRRRVEHEALECQATLRRHQQPDRGPPGGECLLHRPSAGDQLLLGAERLGRLDRRLLPRGLVRISRGLAV